jgi:hypothetical protein
MLSSLSTLTQVELPKCIVTENVEQTKGRRDTVRDAKTIFHHQKQQVNGTYRINEASIINKTRHISREAG